MEETFAPMRIDPLDLRICIEDAVEPYGDGAVPTCAPIVQTSLFSFPSLTVRWSSPCSAGELFSLLHFAAPSLFDDEGGFVTWLARHLAPAHPGSPETVRDRPRLGSRRTSRRAATARPRRNGCGGR